MICWRNLDGVCVDDGWCPSCNATWIQIQEARADFFKALVAVYCANPIPGSPVKGAEELMSEIERRVEAGTLFGGGGREEGA